LDNGEYAVPIIRIKFFRKVLKTKLLEGETKRAMWKVGWYSNIVLTVIAVSLVGLLTKQVSLQVQASPEVRPVAEKPETSRPQRKISILWMGDERWLDEFGGTHIVGFHEPARPQWYPPSKIRLISYLKRVCVDNDRIRQRVREAKGHPNNGGYWLVYGHEPDITGTEPSWEEHKQRRIEQYNLIREEDPDAWNHPVFIFYDMTSTHDYAPGTYPGWEHAFTGDDHDIFVIDCYPGKEDGTLDYRGMEKAATKLVKEVGLARSKGQFIPNFDACYLPGHKPPPLVEQFEWWSERFDIAGVCFWNSGIGSSAIGVYEDEYLQEQVKEINRRLGLL